MSGWRVWFAFEIRPGIRNTAHIDRSGHWRGLANACRMPDGKIDGQEYGYWLEILVDYGHLWGQA